MIKYRKGLPTKKSVQEYLRANGNPQYYTFSQIKGVVNLLFQREHMNTLMRRISEKLNAEGIENEFHPYISITCRVGCLSFTKQES